MHIDIAVLYKYNIWFNILNYVIYLYIYYALAHEKFHIELNLNIPIKVKSKWSFL